MGIGAMAMVQKPALQRQQPVMTNLTITLGVLEPCDGRLHPLAMGVAMAMAEAPPGPQPALLKPQMQVKVPEQTAAGAIENQSIRAAPGGLIFAKALQ